jgi:hypothetical protein
MLKKILKDYQGRNIIINHGLFVPGKWVKKDPKVTLVNLTKVPFWTNQFRQCLF